MPSALTCVGGISPSSVWVSRCEPAAEIGAADGFCTRPFLFFCCTPVRVVCFIVVELLFDDEGADDDDAEACPPFRVRVGMRDSVGWAWSVVPAEIGPCWADTGDVAGIGP